jgi:3-hydroxyacyl-CoA dehydrogenase/enoyl-CoA hydratase/3-hydroxybutyryl-CoA epimerase
VTSRTDLKQPDLFSAAAEGTAPGGLRLDVRADGIAMLTFDSPGEKVNTLTTTVMESLDGRLSEIRADGTIKGVIFRSGKPGVFIAGADIDEIEGIADPGEGEGKSRRGQQVFQRIADLAVPTVAAIGGACLGGGFELALACDFRIAADSPRTDIGLPEVRLGILPGFGGTQRLPALIGMGAALELILAGKTLDARRARRARLVDRVVPEVLLDEQAARILERAWARIPAVRRTDGHRHPWRGLLGLESGPSFAARVLEATPPGRALIGWAAGRRLARRVSPRDYPAPFQALRAVVAGPRLGLARGLDYEARLLGELITSRTSRNLVFLFRATTAAKSDPGVVGPVPPLRAVRKVGIIGAGRMGAGIAAASARAGVPVRMRDVSWDALARGVAAASAIVARDLSRGRIDPRKAASRRAAISPTAGWSGFRAADLVVEAVVERLDVKREVFARLEDLCSPEAILASNTSSIPIAEISGDARRPERFIGLHFFNPVDRMPLVEVITHRGTDRAVTASAVAFAKSLGKTSIVVRDGPGFLVNRLLMPYLGEALLVFEEGGKVEEVDGAMRGFGMPMGPFELLDTIGLDVAQHVARVLAAAFGERLPAPRTLEALTAAGRTGAAGRAGFYRYDADGKRRGADRAARRLVVSGEGRPKSREPAGRPAGRLDAVQERLILPMIDEAALALGEGVVRTPVDVDLGMVLGTGFPPFRGGLLRFADSVGTANLVERLEALAGMHGPRFAPAGHLKDLARAGRTFHPGTY